MPGFRRHLPADEESGLDASLESLNWKIRGKQAKFLSALRLVQGLCERGAGREETERPVIVHQKRVVAGLRRASLE